MFRCYGIDYSMSCPCITGLTEESDSFVNSKVCYRIDSNKYTGKFQNIVGELPEEYSHEIERFTNIAKWALNIVKDGDLVVLEDYSLGSKGRIFNVAENTGILKHTLYHGGIKYICIPPTVIKKFATGKGNSDKIKMYEAFKKDQGIDLIKLLSFEKKISSPLTDIVDSYYIARYAFDQLKNKEI